MNVGVNKIIDREALAFYEKYYDVVDTPDFQNDTRLLKAEHGMRYIGNKNEKVCRFCHKREPEVQFTKIAHVFPESIGNKALASYYECDACNEQFGKTIENDYGNFFQFYHAVSGIRGKRKIPKVKSKKGTINNGMFIPDYEFYWEPMDGEQGNLCLKFITHVPMDNLQLAQHTIEFEDEIPKCCPIGVYKAFVKMAITVMPFTELHLFDHTIEWLLDPQHSNIFSPKKLIVRYKMIPGFNVTKYPHFFLYRRKKNVWDKPYMIFNLTYGNFSFLLEIPRDNDINKQDIWSIPFPPIPFFTSSEGDWDLSDKDLKEGAKHNIELQFDAIQDVTNDTTLTVEDGKRIVRTKI